MNQQPPNGAGAKKEFLYERVADELESDIISGHFGSTKLPSEQELCTKYNVSRTIIRESLKILSERHLVMSVVGSGAYITSPSSFDLAVVINRMTLARSIDINDIFELRLILETKAAALATVRGTEEEFEEMESIVNTLARSDLSSDERTALDNEFHIKLCEASHNKMLAILAKAIRHIVSDSISKKIQVVDSDPKLAVMSSHYGSHRRILSALRDKDPDAAKSLVYDHLYSTRSLYDRYSEALSPADEL